MVLGVRIADLPVRTLGSDPPQVDAKHAFRNRSRQPAGNVVTSPSIGRFLREITMPSGDPLEHFLETAKR